MQSDVAYNAKNEVIILNVGGILHTTTRATLMQYPYSMLGSMFSGRRYLADVVMVFDLTDLCLIVGRFTPSVLTDSQGHVFIDRDGSLFRIVLNFMRTSRLLLPAGFKEIALLEAEADFYQIPELTIAVKEYIDHIKQPHPLAGHYLEVVEFEETAYFSRFYMTPPPKYSNGSFKSGGLVISGHREALATLPLQSRTLDSSTVTDKDFGSVEFVDKSYQKVSTSNADKMPLFHHLSQSGWKLINSSFNYGTDNDGSYIVHKYIWQFPLDKPSNDIKSLLNPTQEGPNF